MQVRTAIVLGVGMLLASGIAASQQMYKWKDEQGVVHYSDVPPPAQEKKVEVKDFSRASAPLAPPVALPYALAQAVKNNPVTLYTGTDCVPCDNARTTLRDRGIPYTEKTVSSAADRARLVEAGGKDTLPFVKVGSKTLNGFAQADLQAALTAAAYPTTKKLPAGYQNPPVQSAAPAAVALPPTPAAPPPESGPAVAPPPSPTGIRF